MSSPRPTRALPKGLLGVSYFVSTNLNAYLPPDAGPPVVTPLSSLNHLYSFFHSPRGPRPQRVLRRRPLQPRLRAQTDRRRYVSPQVRQVPHGLPVTPFSQP
jgi:hypothetical protein